MLPVGTSILRWDGRQEMNRPLFDPELLGIAAEVRAKPWRQRWLNLALPGRTRVPVLSSLRVMEISPLRSEPLVVACKPK
jgi:hypothetical protein